MAVHPQINALGAVVVDANILVAICANEAGGQLAASEIAKFASQNYQLFAPGVIVGETLYALCGKYNNGTLSPRGHAAAILALAAIMQNVEQPRNGDKDLILVADQPMRFIWLSRSSCRSYSQHFCSHLIVSCRNRLRGMLRACR